MKAILLALLASLSFGIAGPVAKVAFNKGMNPDGFGLAYAIGLLTFALITIVQRGAGVLYPNVSTFVWGLAAGLLCAVGFKASSVAMAMPTSLIAIVTLVVATYPIISAGITLPLMNEAQRIILPRFFAGALFVIGGGYLVTTSMK